MAAEVSEPTARKWVSRYLAEGEAGLLDRSSAANHVHNRTPEERIAVICALRRLRMTGAEIAACLEMAETTVSGILTRSGLGRLGRLGLEPPQRYERARPGELVHIDVKKLGRIEGGAGHRIVGRQKRRRNPRKTDGSGVPRSSVGYECVHVCVDTRPGSPTSRCSKTRRRPPQLGSLAAPFASTAATGSESRP